MTYVLLWPLLIAILLAFFSNQKTTQWVNLILHAPWIIFCAVLIKNTQDSKPFANTEVWGAFPLFKSKIAIGVDPLNLSLIALTILLSTCLSFYFINSKKISKYFLILFQFLNFATIGSLMAADAFLFYIFWEFMLIPLFFLIGHWGSENRVYAALKFFAMTLAGSLGLLAAIIYIAAQSRMNTLLWSEISLESTALIAGAPWLIWAFLIAFLVKIPLWPLHTWLPDAHTEAPTAVSVMLAGILLKLGVYGILRWGLALFPVAYFDAAQHLIVLAIIGIVLGSYGAFRQKDIKRMIAYSSVAHLGFIALGAFLNNEAAQTGAFFQNFAHGLSTGLLFLCFGIIYDRTHSRKLADYGGLASKERFLSFAFVFAAMASVALPGLPGFVGEFLILSGTFYVKEWLVLVPLVGVVLGALYTLTLVKTLFFGKVSALVETHPINLKWNEVAAIVPLLIGLVILGIAPQFFIAWTQGGLTLLR